MSSAKLISSSQVQVAWIFHSQNGKGVHLRDSLYFICKLRSTSPALAYRFTPIRSQTALSCVLEFQKLEKNLVCFPVIPKGEFRYWCIICNCPLIDHVIRFREMYHGLRWRNDKHFFAPMAITPCGNVFLGDFVDFGISGVTSIGHVLQFVCHVRYTLSQMCALLYTPLPGRPRWYLCQCTQARAPPWYSCQWICAFRNSVHSSV